jgi:hypothetical protein
MGVYVGLQKSTETLAGALSRPHHLANSAVISTAQEISVRRMSPTGNALESPANRAYRKIIERSATETACTGVLALSFLRARCRWVRTVH